MKLLRFAAIIGLSVAALVPAAMAAEKEDDPKHCPAHNTEAVDKNEDGAASNDVVLDEGVSFCVKAGSAKTGGNTGILIADGETTLQEYLYEAGIRDGSGEKGRDVSYYVVYPPNETTTTTLAPTTTTTAEETTTTTPAETTTTTGEETTTTTGEETTTTTGEDGTDDEPRSAANEEDELAETGINHIFLLFGLVALGLGLAATIASRMKYSKIS